MKLDYATAIINIRINLSLTALTGFLGVPYTLVNRCEILFNEDSKEKIKLLYKENNIQMEKIK